MKRATLICLLVATSAPAAAATNYEVTRRTALRSLPDRNAPARAYYARGTIVGVTRFRSGWARIPYRGTQAFIRQADLRRRATPSASPNRPSSSSPAPAPNAGSALRPTEVWVCARRVSVRLGPGTNHLRVATMEPGFRITAVRRSGGWLAYDRSGGRGRGWVAASFLRRGSTSAAENLRPGDLNGGLPGAAVAAAPYQATVSGLRVRATPGGRVYGSLRSQQRVSVNRRSGEWLGFLHAGRPGWAHENYLRRVTGAASLPAGATGGGTGSAVGNAPYRVTVERLNVRAGASLGASRVGSLARGAQVRVDRRLNGWLRFDFSGSKGWASERYLERVTGAASIPAGALSQTPGTALANLPYRVTAGTTLRVRTTPGGGRILGRLRRGDRVVGVRLVGPWVGHRFRGQLAWSHGAFLERVTGSQALPPGALGGNGSGATTQPTAYETRRVASVRSQPSTAGPQVRRAPAGEVITGTRRLGVWVGFLGAGGSLNWIRSSDLRRLGANLGAEEMRVGNDSGSFGGQRASARFQLTVQAGRSETDDQSRPTNTRSVYSLSITGTASAVLGDRTTRVFSLGYSKRMGGPAMGTLRVGNLGALRVGSVPASDRVPVISNLRLGATPLGPLLLTTKGSLGVNFGVAPAAGGALGLETQVATFGELTVTLEAGVAAAGVRGRFTVFDLRSQIVGSVQSGRLSLSTSSRVEGSVSVTAFARIGPPVEALSATFERPIDFLNFTLYRRNLALLSGRIFP